MAGNFALYSLLTRYWKLNEASGSRAEALAGETLTDNNTVGSATGLVYPLAASFVKASAESLSRADNATLSLGGDVAFSWMFWLKLPDVNVNAGPNTKPIIAKWSSSSTEYEFDIGINGFLRFIVRNAANTAFAAASVAITANVWHMVVGYHDPVANTVGISIDGGAAVTGALSGGLRDSTNSFRIGGNDTGGAANSTDGQIGPVGLWRGYVFSGADITYLYNGGLGVTLEEMAGITPAVITSVGATVNPTVVKGGIALSPQPASGVGETTLFDPVKSSASAEPEPVGAVSSGTVDTILGSVVLGGQASAVGETLLDEIQGIGENVTPDPVDAVGETDGIAVKGSILVIPTPASVLSETDGGAVKGSVLISPTVFAVGATVAGNILSGAPTLTPEPAGAIGGTAGPTILIPAASTGLRDRAFKGMNRAKFKGMR